MYRKWRRFHAPGATVHHVSRDPTRTMVHNFTCSSPSPRHTHLTFTTTAPRLQEMWVCTYGLPTLINVDAESLFTVHVSLTYFTRLHVYRVSCLLRPPPAGLTTLVVAASPARCRRDSMPRRHDAWDVQHHVRVQGPPRSISAGDPQKRRTSYDCPGSRNPCFIRSGWRR